MAVYPSVRNSYVRVEILFNYVQRGKQRRLTVGCKSKDDYSEHRLYNTNRQHPVEVVQVVMRHGVVLSLVGVYASARVGEGIKVCKSRNIKRKKGRGGGDISSGFLTCHDERGCDASRPFGLMQPLLYLYYVYNMGII